VLGRAHYVPAKELVPASAAVGELTQGLAWVEVFTASDETVAITSSTTSADRAL